MVGEYVFVHKYMKCLRKRNLGYLAATAKPLLKK